MFTVSAGSRGLLLVRAFSSPAPLVRHPGAGGDPFASAPVVGSDDGRALCSALSGNGFLPCAGMTACGCGRGGASRSAVSDEEGRTPRNNVAKLTKLTRTEGVRPARV